jgi:hypothetical protein
MAEWLIADVRLLGVHLQLWMLLVAGYPTGLVSVCVGNAIGPLNATYVGLCATA